ncbi:MAG: hypothetical protein EB071_10530, partial [Gammaproteobacteria bacterium]|nr:hypothetical protein [Gammaproteobacteria bacterium]
MSRLILLMMLVSLLEGCSVYKALSQPGPADLKGIGPGSSRAELLSRFGAPLMVDNDSKGNKLDVFQFQSGFHQASKIRALPYLAADVFTLTLAELILWPIELTAMETATCTGAATYDGNLKVVTWVVNRKTDSSG